MKAHGHAMALFAIQNSANLTMDRVGQDLDEPTLLLLRRAECLDQPLPFIASHPQLLGLFVGYPTLVPLPLDIVQAQLVEVSCMIGLTSWLHLSLGRSLGRSLGLCCGLGLRLGARLGLGLRAGLGLAPLLRQVRLVS